jgi:hypothetical protein
MKEKIVDENVGIIGGMMVVEVKEEQAEEATAFPYVLEGCHIHIEQCCGLFGLWHRGRACPARLETSVSYVSLHRGCIWQSYDIAFWIWKDSKITYDRRTLRVLSACY